MKRKSAYILFVAVAVFSTLAALASVALLRYLRDSKSYSSPDIFSYQNSDYGFEMEYPKDFSLENNFKSYYFLPDRWRAAAPEGQDGKAILAIPVFRIEDFDGVATGKSYPLYFAAEVRIGVSSNPQAILDCLKTDPGYTAQKHEKINLNGTEFERFEFEDAAMMKYVRGVSYRTLKDGKCFAVEQIKTGSSYRDESMSAGISDRQLDSYYEKAGEIARTFRFIR